MAGTSNRKSEHIELRLEALQDLLDAPEPRPLEGRFEERTGVERILDRLRSRNTGRLESLSARFLVEEMPGPGTRERVDAALKALWRYQDERLGEEIVTIRRDGIRALGKGSLFLLACMLVSAVASESTFLPDLLRSLISEGFIIAGWVGLWHPMELLLYEWWPVARDRRLYRLVANMTYSVEPAGAESSAR